MTNIELDTQDTMDLNIRHRSCVCVPMLISNVAETALEVFFPESLAPVRLSLLDGAEPEKTTSADLGFARCGLREHAASCCFYSFLCAPWKAFRTTLRIESVSMHSNL